MNFDELKQQCLACQRCGLCETRTHVVFGQGVPDAEVFFVGEGPGANEDAQGLPFVGRSGQLLDHYLEAIDLDRSKNIYIANIVKCRPPETNCQGLFNQIHKKSTKKVPEALYGS